jgi:hypothetical protein
LTNGKVGTITSIGDEHGKAAIEHKKRDGDTQAQGELLLTKEQQSDLRVRRSCNAKAATVRVAAASPTSTAVSFTCNLLFALMICSLI